mmetsp:Transcript_35769/g.83431  ORF Transcript_35769/g.83431 Transcript_35769/m.83431 type:complete len:1585 (+) Transcript_35769:757-5511(+)
MHVFAEPSGGKTGQRPPTRRRPVIPDDAKVADIVATEARGRSDGIQAWLDVRHIVQQIADADLAAGELLKEFRIRVAFVGVRLVSLLALLRAEQLQLLLLLGVRRRKLQHLVETSLGPAGDVQNLGEEGPGCEDFREGRRTVRVDGLDVQNLVTIELQCLEADVDLRGGILGPETQRVTLIVRKAAAFQVKLKVVNGSLVAVGNSRPLHRHGHRLGTMGHERLGSQFGLAVLSRQDLHEMRGGAQLLRWFGGFDVVKEVGAPLLQLGVEAGGMLVVTEAELLDALGAELLEGLIDLASCLVEENVRAVAKAEHSELGVLQIVGRGRLEESLHVLPELHRRLGHLTLTSCGHDRKDLRLLCEVADGHVVEGEAFGLHASTFQLKLKVLRHHLRIACVRAIENGDTLSGDLLAHALLEVLQEVLVAHGLPSARLVTVGELVLHGILEKLRMLWRGPLQGGEAILVAHEGVHGIARDALVVQLEAVELRCHLLRVVAIQWPVSALDCIHLLLHHRLVSSAMAPVDAGGVGNHNGGTVVGLGLLESLDGLVHIRGQGHGGHVGVLVHHCDSSEVLLLDLVPSGGHLHGGSLGGGFGDLRARVAVAFGVQHQDVHVLTCGEDVVEATEPDVVSPAISPDDPMRRCHQHVGLATNALQLLRCLITLGLRRQELQNLWLQSTTLLRVVNHIQPPLEKDLQLGGDLRGSRAGLFQEFLHIVDQLLAALGRTQGHAQAVLGSVLEQGACPSRSLAMSILAEWAQAIRAAPDGGAAAAVGNDHTVAEHLRQQLDVGCLTTAGAGAAELNERLLELRALHGGLLHEVVFHRHLIQGVLPVVVELLLGVAWRLHDQSVVRAHLNAHGTARAVVRGKLNAVVQASKVSALGLARLEAFRGGLHLLLVQQERANHGMGADHAAEVALGAFVRNPDRDLLSQSALLVLGLADRRLATGSESTHCQLVGGSGVDTLQESGAELISRFTEGAGRGMHLLDGILVVLRLQPRAWIANLVQVLRCGRQGSLVRADDLRRLLAIHSVDGALKLLFRILWRKDSGEIEEGSLHHLVDALGGQSYRAGDCVCIDGVELYLLLRDGPSQLGGELILQLLHGLPWAVHHESTALPHLGQHVELGEERRVVASDVVSTGTRLNLVFAADRSRAKTQVRHGGSARFLRGVVEVPLRVELCALTNDSCSGLVCTDRPVGSQSEEDGLCNSGILGVDSRTHEQAGMCHIVIDAHSEVPLRHLLQQVVKDRLDVARRELLASQAVIAADDFLVDASLTHRSEDVRVQRQRRRQVFLGAVQHGNRLHRFWQFRQKVLGGEGPEKANLQNTDLLSLGSQIVHRLLCSLRRRAHDHDTALCLGVAVVLEELVLPPGDHANLVHDVLHDAGHGVVIPVRRDSGLVVDLRILSESPHHGVLRIQAALSEGIQLIPGHDALHGTVRDRLDALDDATRARPIEEVNERHRAAKGGKMCDKSKIHDFLRIVCAQQSTAGRANSHHVRVIAEDRQGLARQCASGNVEHGRKELSGTEIHVRDHEKQALRGGERRAQGSAGQSPVKGTSRAELGLHLLHLDRLPEHVLTPLRREFVHGLAHAG